MADACKIANTVDNITDTAKIASNSVDNLNDIGNAIECSTNIINATESFLSVEDLIPTHGLTNKRNGRAKLKKHSPSKKGHRKDFCSEPLVKFF